MPVSELIRWNDDLLTALPDDIQMRFKDSFATSGIKPSFTQTPEDQAIEFAGALTSSYEDAYLIEKDGYAPYLAEHLETTVETAKKIVKGVNKAARHLERVVPDPTFKINDAFRDSMKDLIDQSPDDNILRNNAKQDFIEMAEFAAHAGKMKIYDEKALHELSDLAPTFN